jgi:hypothetical protein
MFLPDHGHSFLSRFRCRHVGDDGRRQTDVSLRKTSQESGSDENGERRSETPKNVKLSSFSLACLYTKNFKKELKLHNMTNIV